MLIKFRGCSWRTLQVRSTSYCWRSAKSYVMSSITFAIQSFFDTSIPAPKLVHYSDSCKAIDAHANGVIWSQLADATRMARPGGYTSTLNGATLWNTGGYTYDGAGNVTRIGSSYYLYDNVSRIGTASFSTLALDGGTPTA